jgi:hypothetical protein
LRTSSRSFATSAAIRRASFLVSAWPRIVDPMTNPKLVEEGRPNTTFAIQDWTANVAEPRVKLRGKFCPISEVCAEVSNLSNQLPEFILSVLYKETKADEDVLALKLDETYRGAGRHLLRLIERRKDEIRRRKALKSQPLNHKSGRE